MTAATPLTRPGVSPAPELSPVSGPNAVGSVAIASGASLSAAIDLESRRLVGIVMPAAWDAANLTFQASADDAAYANLYDSAGTEYTVTAAAARLILLPLVDFIGIRFLKVRSGTSGTPVNQSATRALTLIAAQ